MSLYTFNNQTGVIPLSELDDNFSSVYSYVLSSGTSFISNIANIAYSVSGANVSGAVANATYANTSGIAATITTNAQPNITSVGTLSNLSVSSNITGGNLLTSGVISATGNILINTNGSLGIGIATPDTELTILGYPQTISYPLTGYSNTMGTDLHITGADGSNTRITQDAFGANSYVIFTGRTARGTAASPLGSQAGDALTQLTARGFSNGTFQFGNVSTGRVEIVAAENFTDTSRATNIQIVTTASGAITPSVVAVFSSGNGLSTTGNITSGNYFIGNGSQLTGVVANSVGTLGNLSVTGNVTSGNYFIGNGSQLTGVVANSVGTLGNLSVTGNVTSGNINTAGALSVTGNASFGNISVIGGVFVSSVIQFANLTTTQINAISPTSRGMTVFNYTTGNVQVYNGTKWANITLS
jgi:hypothetical protein